VIRALAVSLFLVPYIPLASFFGYLWARLVRSPAVLYGLGRFGVRVALFLAGTRIEVQGMERLGDARNTVIMANHVSHLDPPVLLQALGVDYKAVAKAEIFRIPFFNQCLRYAGFVAVDRGDRVQSRGAIAQAAASLRSGNCFLIFPEGTRSRTGALGEFKKGGFVVALEAGSRIVPVALMGTQSLMPKGGFRIRPGRVRVEVLEPVEAGGYSYDDRDNLIALVRGRVAVALGEGAPPGLREERFAEAQR
jgi:1-acyl-sn-glycerol-3-phosphate acyltransferase